MFPPLSSQLISFIQQKEEQFLLKILANTQAIHRDQELKFSTC